MLLQTFHSDCAAILLSSMINNVIKLVAASPYEISVLCAQQLLVIPLATTHFASKHPAAVSSRQNGAVEEYYAATICDFNIGIALLCEFPSNR